MCASYGFDLVNLTISGFLCQYVKNGILEHHFLFMSELKIPLNQIHSMRTDSENFSDKESMLKIQFLLPVPYVCITYSKNGKAFVSKFAFTYEPQKLKKYIEDALQLEVQPV